MQRPSYELRISDLSSDVCSSDLYHAQYLAFLERARTEWLRALGYGQELLRVEHGLVFAVRAMRIDFRVPARLDDALDVSVALRQCRHSSLVVAQRSEEHPSDIQSPMRISYAVFALQKNITR